MKQLIDRTIKVIISFCYYIVIRISKTVLSIIFQYSPTTLVVLTFHSVKSKQTARFKKQMAVLLDTGAPILLNDTATLTRGCHHIAVTFDDGFQSVLDNALPILQRNNIPAIMFITTGYLGDRPGWIKNSEHENAKEQLVTGEQIKGLPNDSVYIGSHCVNHPKLASVNRVTKIEELAKSKEVLERLLSKKVDSLSFPHGSYDKEVIAIAKETGYKRLFLNVPTFRSTKLRNVIVGRINVTLDDWPIEYTLKMKGAYQWLPIAILVKRLLLSLVHKFTPSK